MGLSVRFNGIELSDYITVLDGYSIHKGAKWKPYYSSIERVNGAEFTHTKYEPKEILVPFAIKGDLNEKYDKLSQALNVDEPKILIFGNAEDRYYLAIPTGDLDFTEVNKTSGTGTITWIVPEGIAHSTVETSFPAYVNSDGVMEATIVNNGTESVPISYEITHNHENGYIGIVSEHGVMQYGYIDELDKEVRKSQILVSCKTGSAISSGMTSGGIVTEPSKISKNGTFKTVTVNGHSCLALDNVGSGSYWHGAAKTITLPKDANGNIGAANFRVTARVWFETGKVSQMGLLEMVVGDVDGNLLCSMHLIKSTSANNKARCILKIQGMGDSQNDVKKIEYEPNYKSTTNENNGLIYIDKKGEKFVFYFGGKGYPFRAPNLTTKKALTVTVFLGQYGTKGAENLVHHMYFRSLYFRTDSVNYVYDIPNRYDDGDVVTIDGESGKIYTNGIPSLDDEMIGTKYFKAPPGETKVQFYYSDFCDPAPTITARIREAYL